MGSRTQLRVGENVCFLRDGINCPRSVLERPDFLRARGLLPRSKSSDFRQGRLQDELDVWALGLHPGLHLRPFFGARLRRRDLCCQSCSTWLRQTMLLEHVSFQSLMFRQTPCQKAPGLRNNMFLALGFRKWSNLKTRRLIASGCHHAESCLLLKNRSVSPFKTHQASGKGTQDELNV